MYFSSTKMAKAITALRAHKRVIVLSLIFAYAVFLLIHPDEVGRFYDLFFGAINVVFIASQVFWIRRVGELGKKLMWSKRWRWGLGTAGLIIYFFLFAYSMFTRFSCGGWVRSLDSWSPCYCASPIGSHGRSVGVSRS